VLCRLGRSKAGKALAFSRPYRTDVWCGCLSVWSCSGWASFSAYMLSLVSPYMYLAVYYLCRLQMSRSSSCPSPTMNKYACLFLFLPALRNLGSGGSEGLRSLICCLWYPFDGSTSPAYMVFPYHGVDSVCFYHFYVPVTHPSVIAKIIMLFLCYFGC
jgi:hypothetical protein